jgi:general secretion pathway protein C
MKLFLSSQFIGFKKQSIATFAVWFLTAASLVFWLLHWPKFEVATQVLLVDATIQNAPEMSDSMARALGQPVVQEAHSTVQSGSSYQLIGVIASASGHGGALISVDGQSPKAYRVGEEIHDGLALESVFARQAKLKRAGSSVLLELVAVEQP